MKSLRDAVIQQIPKYFDIKKRDLFRNLRQLFDPKHYKFYADINAASEHGTEIFDSVITAFKEKKLPIGESFRIIKWKELDVEKMRFEYKALRIILYQNRNIYPNDLDARLKYIIFELETKANIFKMTVLLLTQFMIYFSGVIVVE